MEIYVAISDFTPPIVDGSQNILEFSKGDTFEIFDCHKTDADWWGARALKSNVVGYVPSRYMQYEERRIGKLLPTDYKNQKETSLKRLSDIQNSPDHRKPEQVIPDTPTPDYGQAATQENQSVFQFAQKFQNVLTNIQKIENMYNDQLEPEPDYNDDVDAYNANIGESKTEEEERKSSTSSDDGLIPPKKLPNPCVESTTRQALHKELLLNYKRGVNVLEKPELCKVLQNRRETQRRKEWDDVTNASKKRTSLEMKLEQRSARMKEDEMKTIEEDDSDKPEFQKVFAKFAQKSNGAVK